jgi:outer membrane protein OmpA-like peptidoglycan-associated protein
LQVRILFLTCCLFSLPALSQPKDAEGCVDHPLINRVPGYFIAECDRSDFGSQEFAVEGRDAVTVDGRKTVLKYALPEGAKGQSAVFIMRNYANALVKLGGKQVNQNPVVVQLRRGDQELWVSVSGYIGEGTVENNGAFYVHIVEKGRMEQVLTAADIFGELERTGRVALYVQFDSGKATVRAESEPLVAEMARLLRENPKLSVYVVGHTDLEGALEPNLKLSQDRADSLMKTLISKHGIAASRLMARGVGPLSPIATNATEAGRKLNRRVELVKR